ncbi:unnamed protein product [Urochloa decumbens]|uniref:Protein kinase domain-containing protein n=1 Tax=Urochloa decumbens TaxID=240449 RepID=A0ABC9AYL8_9POAL
MVPTSAAVLFPAAAAALMVMAVLWLPGPAAAATAPPRAPAIGLHGCDTICGSVKVPYPFGFGPSHCYWPGLNLTCDTSHHHPRLLLGDGTLRVTEISLEDATVRVMRAGSIINTTGDFTSDGWNASVGNGFTEYGYWLSSSENELVVSGCNVMATLLETDTIISGCATFCTKLEDGYILPIAGTWPCCQAPIAGDNPPTEVQARWLYRGNHTAEQDMAPLNVFVAEKGWVEKNIPDELKEAPLVLGWAIKRGLPKPNYSCGFCDNVTISRMLCKSEHSECSVYMGGYTCRCKDGYDGNPYLAGGCQDIDECKLPIKESGCLVWECINTMGSYEYRCPDGTYGYPGIKGGCIKISNSTTAAIDAMSAMAAAPAQVGLPNCSTTCGGVRVPYPFGFGPPHCYWPGFNLTCDTSRKPPRLLLDSDGTLQVVDISLPDSTVRVIHPTIIGSYTYDVLPPDIDETYTLSTRNEIILFACDTKEYMFNIPKNGCFSTCSWPGPVPVPTQTHGGYCTGHDGCCHAPIPAGSLPKTVDANDRMWWPYALISEEGLIDKWYTILNKMTKKQQQMGISTPNYVLASPIVLRWEVKQGFSAPDDNSGQCPGGVASHLCKSKDSNCRQENGGFTCYCSSGYHGNPYLADGCQDINECDNTTVRNSCFGDCINLPGHFECRCPQGTHGNASMPAGCVSSRTGLIIGLSIASGPALLLLVLGTILVLRKIKQHKTKLLKQKYFKQNRGQLLQQLVSQHADIAERMIIPVDELAKATNSFDRARELGGGGHGTVYKGILSNLQVVAIKKSRITVQKEIDEFINEVAILSQINHRNVVKLFGCCLETEVPLLVYEFVSNGTLYNHLHVEGAGSLSWGNRLRIATEIATSLAYLHSSVSIQIIHRDIKSSNILLDDTLTSKISDFGASRYIPTDKSGLTTRVQGTIGYLDPMYFYTRRLTEKSDIYSFGVILIELLTRKKPFSYLSAEGDGLVAHFVNLLAEGNLVQITDPQVVEEGGEKVQEVAALAASCVNIRGEERPTMRQVEHTLEGLLGTKKKDDTVVREHENQAEGQRVELSSRRYSLEQEMIMSSGYPR